MFTMSMHPDKKKVLKRFQKSKLDEVIKTLEILMIRLHCSYIFPTMDELANQITYVMTHFGLKSFIGFGVGAGANVLCRFALAHPEKVSALCLINCNSTQAGWIEWGYQKLNARHLRSKGMTQGVLDYLMWHHFGRVSIFLYLEESKQGQKER